MVQRLGQREGDVTRVRVLARQHVLEAPVVARRPAGEPHQVAVADAPARAEQQPGEGHVVSGVGDHPQHRDEVDDLGCLQQPGEAHDLDGDVASLQRLAQRPEQPLGADQHGHVPPVRVAAVLEPALVRLRDLPGDEIRLDELVGEQRHADLALAGAGLGDQRGTAAALLRDGFDHRVRQRQDPPAGAEVGRQRERLRRGAAGRLEVLPKGQQVVHGRAAEGIDRLAGVADRHDRGARRAEHLDQSALRDVGVLVLVQ
jgi:hypothetical protein